MSQNNKKMMCIDSGMRKYWILTCVLLALLGVGVCVWSFSEGLHRSVPEVIFGVLFAIATVAPIITLVGFTQPKSVTKKSLTESSSKHTDQYCVEHSKMKRNLHITLVCSLFSMLVLVLILSMPNGVQFKAWEVALLTLPLIVSGVQAGMTIREYHNTEHTHGLNAFTIAQKPKAAAPRQRSVVVSDPVSTDSPDVGVIDFS